MSMIVPRTREKILPNEMFLNLLEAFLKRNGFHPALDAIEARQLSISSDFVREYVIRNYSNLVANRVRQAILSSKAASH